VERPFEEVGLGVDDARAHRLVPIRVEFHRVDGDEARPLARDPVRAYFTEHNARSETLAHIRR
jgi:hypothetical protein